MNMAIRDLTLVPTTLDAVEAFQFRPSAYDPVFTDLFIPVFNGTVELGRRWGKARCFRSIGRAYGSWLTARS